MSTSSLNPTDDCPICMDRMSDAELLYDLPCAKCDYNFCTNCVGEFVRSSKDDYQEASDGSNQVKVRVVCPQCRSDYPMDIADVQLLRRAYTLAGAVFDSTTGKSFHDSELSASQLTRKRDFGTSVERMKNVRCAHTTFLKVHREADEEKREALNHAKSKWERLFEGVDGSSADGSDSPASPATASDGQTPSPDRRRANRVRPVVDVTLFMGLEDFMGKDEQAFVAELLTSGETDKLHRAAMILHGILKLSMTGQIKLATKFNRKLTFDQQQKLSESKERIKRSFPLPNHMPGYFTLTCFPRNRRYVQFYDIQWNGDMTPPQKMKRIWNQVYEDFSRPDTSSRVAVQSVRGPGGRIGLRRNDIVTHVNDMEWQGTAEQLQELLWSEYERNGDAAEITLAVNANPETAQFLKYRQDLVSKSRVELV